MPVALFSQKKPVPASQDDFPFNHIEYLSSEQGLNGSEVNWMMQDKHGFLWFITNVALNRYDGYSFRSWSYSADDPHSISSGWYFGLFEDKNGTLWFPDIRQGLYSFDPYHEKFMHYVHQPGNEKTLGSNPLNCIAIQNDSIIWIATAKGLDKFDPRTNSFTHFVHSNYDTGSISPGVIYRIVFEEKDPLTGVQNNLWIINSSPGIDCFDTQTGRVIKHFDSPYPPAGEGWDGTSVFSLIGMKNNTIWLGSNDKGIFGFNTASGQFIQIKNEPRCHSSAHNKYYYNVLEDHAGNLWTINDNNEIVYYNRSNRKFYYYPVSKNNMNFLRYAPLIFEDLNQKIWIGTDDGLIVIDTKFKKIIACRHDESDLNSISANFINGIKRVKQGQLLVCAGAINIFNKNENSFSRLQLIENGKPINYFDARDIYEDSKGIIWFTGDFGISSYDPRSKKSHLFHLRNDSADQYSFLCIGIVEDNKGRYWVPNWRGYGLYLFDPATSKVRAFTVHDVANSISTNSLALIFKDSRGILYIGGFEGGFITFDPDSETFKIYHHDSKDPTSVNNETAQSFIEAKNTLEPDRQGLIWFGTMGGGINVFDPATKKFKAFTTRDGLVHNTVYTLIEDKKGNYWAGTHGGISCFTPPVDPFSPGAKIKFRNYDKSDGLPSNDLNFNAAFCDEDGTLYFGTRSGGLFYFHPDGLKDNDFIPPVYITEFRLKNKLVSVNDSNSVLKSPIEFTHEIRLNYKQNMISFSFAALNYIHPEKNKYAYMLEEYDEDWIYTDASKRFATYTNLDPGKYIFKVKGSNNDGVWNQKPTEIKIIITPPFWQTVWFKILVIVAVAGAVYAAYRYRLKQVLKLQQIRNRIAADLHDDIGSTLNSISVYSEVAKKDPSRANHALTMIGESSRRIIDSLSDIVWTINPQNDSFDRIIFRMRSLTHNLLKAKKIDCTFKIDEDLDKINMPMEIRRNFYLIFKEALNNLVKYSGSTRASVLLSCENKNVSFIIRDNGVGFDSSSTFNGNGINNMKRRAAEINANLNIESSPGRGTSIELNLKL